MKFRHFVFYKFLHFLLLLSIYVLRTTSLPHDTCPRSFLPKTCVTNIYFITHHLRTFARKRSHAQILSTLATPKGNDLLLPKRQKNWGLPTSFWREHAPKNILNLTEK